MLGLSVIILFKSLLHVFCSLVFSAHNSSVWKGSEKDQNYASANASRRLAKNFKRYPDMPYES